MIELYKEGVLTIARQEACAEVKKWVDASRFNMAPKVEPPEDTNASVKIRGWLSAIKMLKEDMEDGN